MPHQIGVACVEIMHKDGMEIYESNKKDNDCYVVGAGNGDDLLVMQYTEQ